MTSNNKRVAWWTNHRGYFLDCRGTFRHQGDFNLLKQYDRLVEGESIEVLITEVQAKMDELQAEHVKNQKDERSRYYKRDREGWYVPDYEVQRWARQERERYERRLKSMKSGGWGPTHTIEMNNDGHVDETTIELFVS